jgi:hypothetical protein
MSQDHQSRNITARIRVSLLGSTMMRGIKLLRRDDESTRDSELTVLLRRPS